MAGHTYAYNMCVCMYKLIGRVRVNASPGGDRGNEESA